MVGITVIGTAAIFETIVATAATRELILLRQSDTHTPIRTPFATLLVLRIVTAGALIDALLHLIIAPDWHSPMFLATVGLAFVAYATGNALLATCTAEVTGKEIPRQTPRQWAIRMIIVVAATCIGGYALMDLPAHQAEMIIAIAITGITAATIAGVGRHNLESSDTLNTTHADEADTPDPDSYEGELSILHTLGRLVRAKQSTNQIKKRIPHDHQ